MGTYLYTFRGPRTRARLDNQDAGSGVIIWHLRYLLKPHYGVFNDGTRKLEQRRIAEATRHLPTKTEGLYFIQGEATEDTPVFRTTKPLTCGGWYDDIEALPGAAVCVGYLRRAGRRWTVTPTTGESADSLLARLTAFGDLEELWLSVQGHCYHPTIWAVDADHLRLRLLLIQRGIKVFPTAQGWELGGRREEDLHPTKRDFDRRNQRVAAEARERAENARRQEWAANLEGVAGF